MSDFEIKKYGFEPWNNTGGRKLKESEPIPSLKQTLLGTNWPVVYILYSDTEDSTEKQLYVGESTSATQRMGDHLANPQRNVFNAVRIIFDKKFNKSAILDVEQSLINLFYADNEKNPKYILQNRNDGQSDSHDYYDRSFYQHKVREIWQELKDNSDIRIDQDYNSIINSKLFKFSPYTVLTEEQNDVCVDVLDNTFNVLESWNESSKPYVACINGKAGTGKTIVLMHMFGMLESPKPISSGKNSSKGKIEAFNSLINRISNYKEMNGLNFAYVCSFDSLHNTMCDVVKGTYGRRSPGKGKVLKPGDLAKSSDPFDVVFIDESHRLFRRSVGMGTGPFRNTNTKLFGSQEDSLGQPYTQMDWILKKAKCVVMVYDENQAVRKQDMRPKDFVNAYTRANVQPEKFYLQGQMRCNGGAHFMDFLDNMLSTDTQAELLKCPDVGSYEIKLFDNAPSLIQAIAEKDDEYGLCRTVCGPGNQYHLGRYTSAINKFKEDNSLTDNDLYNDPLIRKQLQDFLLNVLSEEDGVLSFPNQIGENQRYIRNLSDWVLKGNPFEIGCIHMVQGYDLNYVGVIFSKELHFDSENHKVYINKNEIEDRNSIPRGLDTNDIEKFILNTYKVLLSRGVQGCYLYAVNTDMQEYLASLGIDRVSE